MTYQITVTENVISHMVLLLSLVSERRVSKRNCVPVNWCRYSFGIKAALYFRRIEMSISWTGIEIIGENELWRGRVEAVFCKLLSLWTPGLFNNAQEVVRCIITQGLIQDFVMARARRPAPWEGGYGRGFPPPAGEVWGGLGGPLGQFRDTPELRALPNLGALLPFSWGKLRDLPQNLGHLPLALGQHGPLGRTPVSAPDSPFGCCFYCSREGDISRITLSCW